MKCKLSQVYLFSDVVMHRMWMCVSGAIKRKIPLGFYSSFPVVVWVVLLSLVVMLQGCGCACCEDGSTFGGTKVGKTTYQYQLQLIDSSDIFKKVSFNNSTIVQQADTNVIEWKLFLRPPQTIMYIETKKGIDTNVLCYQKYNACLICDNFLPFS